jgi:hypothetical protein
MNSYCECERTIRTTTDPFIDLGLRVRFRGGSGSVNDGCEFIVVPKSNLVRLVGFIGHGNTMGGPAARLGILCWREH